MCTAYDTLGGGGITAFCSNLTFTGNTTFLENKAYCGALDYGGGGAILAYGNTVLSFNGASSLIKNSGTIGGAIHLPTSAALDPEVHRRIPKPSTLPLPTMLLLATDLLLLIVP